jgi:excisionase family DNA binding protein
MAEAPARFLLSITAAAECLGVKRSMMYQLIDAGEVTTVKIGRRRLVTAESLQAYVQRLTAVE